MKFLFHITGYKSPEQFSWLYQAIYNDHDLFIIHVDKKSSPLVHEGFRRVVDGHENTHFVPSIGVIWGGTGLIDAEMAAINLGLALDDGWQYMINLSSQDYPIVSTEEVRNELARVWPANFVQCIPLKDVHWRIRKRCWFRYLEAGQKRYFTPIPTWPNRNVPIAWYGVWWHILTRDFCAWWLHDPNSAYYYQVLRQAGMPDELLIQNLINNSPFRSTLRSECKHEIIWRRRGEPRSASARPNVMTMQDLPLLTSSRAFFARKFDYSIDRNILETLANRLDAPIPDAAHSGERQPPR